MRRIIIGALCILSAVTFGRPLVDQIIVTGRAILTGQVTTASAPPVTSPCTYGTVTATDLQGLASGVTGEITIQTGVSGDERWDQVLMSETTQFTGTTGLTVSMGRPGSTTNDEMSGAAMPLMVSSGGANFWSARPIPPQLGTTYDIVLSFTVTGGNVNSATAGAILWETCGYSSR